VKNARIVISPAMSRAYRTEAYIRDEVSGTCPNRLTRLNRQDSSDTKKSNSMFSIIVVLFSIGSTDTMSV
jgi:hypothetical protein